MLESRIAEDYDEASAPDYEQDIVRTIMSVLSSTESITADDLDQAVAAELGIPGDSTVLESLLDTVMDRLITDQELAYLPGDYVVAPKRLCAGIVLTTRMASPYEEAPLGTDFAGFKFVEEELGSLPKDAVAGDLIIARHQGGEIVLERASESIPIRDEEIAKVLRAYEAETREAGLSVAFEELVLDLLDDDPTFFAEPRAPLSEMVTAAGLEIRGTQIGADQAVWTADAYSRGVFRIHDLAADEAEQKAAFEVFRAFQAVTEGEPHELATIPGLRKVLDLMADYGVLLLVTDQFFGKDDDPALIDATAEFARRLTAAASRPLQRAIAAWLTAVVAERRCDPLAAAEALADAVRHAPEYAPTIDRLAWTRSDQGRAEDAIALWRQLDIPDNPDLIAVEEAMASAVNPAAQGLRRNEPCWCGSGRKFKVCHLRITDLPPLPDRVKWLLRKEVAYVDRRGDPLPDVIAKAAWALADYDQEKFESAMEDPLVLDVVLSEYGWFDRFLAERGPLLPEDEQLLLASWQLVSRSIFEIVDVQPGDGVTLQDLRTGDTLDVRERTMSGSVTVGQVICARVLPDGGSNQICGGVFFVRPGREARVIDILDEPNPTLLADRLLAYLAAESRPPTLQTTEGEPLIQCEMVLQVFDSEHAREVLDRRYVSSGPDEWHQEHDTDGKALVRATMRLEGSLLSIETMSEERMDRVREELDLYLADEFRVVSDVREELEFPSPSLSAEPPTVVDPEMKAALAGWIEQMENRWCIEPVPALGGLTPQEAAADPTRREQVIRLIDSFDRLGGVAAEGATTMRPDRLRILLGISQ